MSMKSSGSISCWRIKFRIEDSSDFTNGLSFVPTLVFVKSVGYVLYHVG